jgi:hypothetical protein
MRGQRDGGPGCHLHGAHRREQVACYCVLHRQGNYSVILSRDWMHDNRYIPSSLHQFLIQWIDDEIEVVHADMSAYIALADAMADWQHGGAQCPSGEIL